MFCPSCGSQLMQSLSYCNRCGASLDLAKTSNETELQPKNVEIMLMAVVAATIIILGMILGALVLMKNGAIAEHLGSAFVVVSFLSMLVIDGLIVSRVISPARRADKRGLAAQPKELNTARGLELGPPAPTVTEQTTRSLEPSYTEDERA